MIVSYMNRMSSFGHRIGAISDVVTQMPLVALTFDDGPDPHCTPRLLRILEKHEARATFFMVGAAASEYPGLVKDCATAGHVVGNHSWNHLAFPMIGRAERRQQIRACSEALKPYESPYFRPPYGSQNLWSYIDITRLRYDIVGWSVDVGDWCNGDSRTMAAQLGENIRPGSIVLLHDAIFDKGQPRLGPTLNCPSLVNREPMLEALAVLLETLGGKFVFVTIKELLAHGQPRRQGFDRMMPRK